MSAIHREVNVQAQCMTWLFAYCDLSWVAQGGPRLQVPCSGRDAEGVRTGQGYMQVTLNQTIEQERIERVDGRAAAPGILSCCVF